LIGDRWTLLVVRDLMFLNRRRFAEFLESGEGIPTNVLADRLRRLEHCGLARKTAYQRRPIRYEYHLTPMGADLFPMLREMVLWANRHIPGTARPPAGFFERPQEPTKG
jgi:DNA-binding HxlR family transcriptional regulator